MKRQLVSGVLCVLFSAGLTLATPVPQDQAAPQESHRQQPDPNRQLKTLTKRLNLTADQQNQILPILKDRQQQMANLMSDGSLSRDDRRSKMRAIREDSDSKIKGVLNDTQKQQYDQMQQEMRERGQQRRGQQQDGQGSPNNN